MRFMQSLTDYLITHAFMKEKVESWAEDGEILTGSHREVQGFEIQYTMNLEASDVKVKPAIFLALIVTWLAKHNPLRDSEGLEAPKFFVQERLGTGRFDLGLKIDFIEKFDFLPAENGSFILDGQRVDPMNDSSDFFDLSMASNLEFFDSHSQDTGLKNE